MILIGTGWLDWNRAERQFDRFGAVHLRTAHDGDDYAPLNPSLSGQHGKLIARVIEVGVSPFRYGLQAPKLNQDVILGEGYVFYGVADEIGQIGLHPEGVRPISLDDGLHREVESSFPWLQPKRLKKVHRCRVELYFDPN